MASKHSFGGWILTTLLVIAAMAVMVRLGFWQLDRLEQRRAFNSRVQNQLDQTRLDLNAEALRSGDLAKSLPDMEYRSVTVTGEYDPSQQVALRNQVWNGELGVHLLTPLRIQGSDQIVIVDRGWIPYDDFTAGSLVKYDEPGTVTVSGVVRRSQSRPEIGNRVDPTLAPGQKRLDAFYMANVDRISQQVSYPLLPVYIQEAPNPAWAGPPYRSQPTLDLSEGPHMGYAIQWFAFAAILGIGYPMFVKRQMEKSDP